MRLRSIVLLLLALASLPGPVSGATLPIAWGLRMGWSQAHFTDDFGDAFPDARNDFTTSGYLRFRFRGALTLQPELGWAPKGGSGEYRAQLVSGGQVTTLDFRSVHRIDYFELPLLVRWDVPTRGSVTPYVLGGPALAFRVGNGHTNVTYTSQTTGSPSPARPAAIIDESAGSFDAVFEAQPIDAGAVGGLGFWFVAGPARWGLEARYTYGVIDVRSGGGSAARNSAIAITTAVELH